MGLTFSHPWWLAGLVLLPAAILLERRARLVHRGNIPVALRCLVLAAVVLALAGPRLVAPVADTSTAFLVDMSLSVPPEERARAAEWVRTAIDDAPERRAAVVAFGATALVDRSPRTGPLEPIRSVPGQDRTDVAAALRLGAAVLPSDAGHRVVILSDGRANSGDMERQQALLEAQGVPVDVVPLSADAGAEEALVAALEAPPNTRVGQRFDLTARVTAREATRARLEILGSEGALLDKEVELAPGDSAFTVAVAVEEPGFHRYRAVLAPDRDRRIENNEASAFTLTAGPPKVLVVAADPAEAAPLMSAFESADRTPVLADPGDVPGSLLGLAQYDAVVLVNVPARALPQSAMESLEPFVRDLGKGLVMIGGEDSFGSGGYRHTPVEKALPVEMEVRDKDRRPDIALAFVIDKSGSMAAATGAGKGPSKIELAKEAVLQASALIRAADQVGLIAFDGDPHALWPVRPFSEASGFAGAVSGLHADGGTNIQSGLEMAASQMHDVRASIKHVILLTDGWSDTGGYEQLLDRYETEGITLSIVAVGLGSAPYLGDLAARGGGRYYAVESAEAIPQILVEETQTSLGTYVIEEPFQPVPGSPSDILSGLNPQSLPALYGYNGTTQKQSATVALWSHLDDPVLAQWQYGLGRAVAWTSDLKRQWAVDWVDGGTARQLALQAVDWTLPAPENDRLHLDVKVVGGVAEVAVQAADAAAEAMDFLSVDAIFSGPTGQRLDARLQQSAPGRYAGNVELPDQGTYLLRVVANDEEGEVGAVTAGVVVPYSPEFDDPATEPTDPRLLALAPSTGGRVLADPARAFDRVSDVRRPHPMWPWLLLAAAVLFPLDVAARRLKVSRAALVAAPGALRDRLTRGLAQVPSTVARPPRTAAMGSLFEARDRARDAALPPTTPSSESQRPDPGSAARPAGAARPPNPTAGQAHDPSAGQAEVDTGADADATHPEDRPDTLAALRRAKRRARGRQQ